MKLLHFIYLLLSFCLLMAGTNPNANIYRRARRGRRRDSLSYTATWDLVGDSIVMHEPKNYLAAWY